MSKATLSLLGLYQYDNTIFDQLVLPEGMDKSAYIGMLLAETAEMEVLLPNPKTLKSVIGIWSSAHLTQWERLWTTTQLEYNPIENYDRKEDWTDRNQTSSSVKSIDKGTGNTSNNDVTKNAGFDSGNLVTSSQNDNKSESNSTQEGESSGESSEKQEHSGRMHGNIGVTTTQQMINEEREVNQWNMYDYLVTEFKRQFLLLVY